MGNDVATRGPKSIDTVKAADLVKRIVARNIASKTWRSACEDEVRCLGTGRAERESIAAYVKAEYATAGAGFSGRWQS